MGIRFLCPNGHKLNVKAFLAGKRGICPECDAKFFVPTQSGAAVEAIEESQPPPPPMVDHAGVTLSAEPATVLDADVWHVRTGAGEQLAPVTTSELRSWIAAGRVDRDCWVWRDGWHDWQRASDAFPELGAVLEEIPTTRPPSFVKESLEIDSGDLLERTAESDVVSAHRRKQRQKRARNKSLTLLLGGMVFLLAVIILLVLLR